MNLCKECNIKCDINKKLNLHICKNCINQDKYTLITKTNSKKIYLLTDNDLVNLTHYYGTTSYRDATYYTKEELINKFCEKYDTSINDIDKKIKELKNIKEQKKLTAENNKKIKQQKRKDTLIKALTKAGLKLRNDSTLCENYIENKSDEYTLQDVVERMCQMKYLFEYCHMNECKHDAYISQQKEIKAGYFPDCSVFDEAEYIALNKYSNGKYPDIYPWQKNNNNII
jgi:hypothetical protein